jgi:high-affinity K+ transport system ATPase subunit B
MSVTPPLSEDELKRRRRRNSIALGLVLTALVVIFYVLTVAKMGPAILNRPL